MPLKKTDTLISFPVTTGSYAAMLEEIIGFSKKEASASVCIANVHMIVTAYQDKQFGPAVRTADIVTPDGLPLTWAMRLLYGIRQPRVAGMDLLPDLIKAAVTNDIPVFFYGGTPDMLEKTRGYLQTTYKQLAIAGMYSPPFRPLTPQEEQQVADTINHSGAKMVFVVLGCPKQEKWMAAMKNRINSVMIGVGGALPVLIGMQKRAPEWMQKNGLEWLYRLGQEPKRLFTRYAVTNTLFVLLVAAAFVRVRIMGQKTSLQQM
jgi:N-acetylglucosaminyldiphosphoundecaprenol N-acetyl-beta-D-mannosaminyltransferase